MGKLLSFYNDLDLSPTMKTALVVSVGLHLFVVIAGMVGLPLIKKDIIPPAPIMIEIVDISDLTTTDKPPAPDRPKKPTVEDAPKLENKKPAPPKVETKEPPKIKPLEKPKVKEETVKPKADTPPPPEEKLEKPKPPIPEKKEEKKKPEAVQQEDPLDSLLKNLQDEETANGQTVSDQKPAEQEQSPLAKFSQKLSATEIDAINAALNTQFASCWNLMAGARNAEDITVSLRIIVRPDRTVQSVKVEDTWLYGNDAFYKAAADAAVRAVRHPNCEVLDLPVDKYELWKDLIFNFNPARML